MKNLIYGRIGKIGGLLFFCLILCFSGRAQGNLESPAVLDFFNSIYNYDFRSAPIKLSKVKSELKNKPEAWLCETNYYWWLMMIGEENEINQAGFEKANQTIIDKLGSIPADQLSPDEIFAIIHAYAYETRYSLHHKKYFQGISNLRKIGPFLEVVMRDPWLNEKYKFLGGLYHYSASVTKEEKPFLRSFFKLAPDSDKEIGYKLLSSAAISPHPLIQTEATYFMMKINLEIAHNSKEAVDWSKKLVSAYPNNILYHYYVLSALAERGYKNSCLLELNTIDKLSETLPGLNFAQRQHFKNEGRKTVDQIN
jgi:hypothetical protein